MNPGDPVTGGSPAAEMESSLAEYWRKADDLFWGYIRLIAVLHKEGKDAADVKGREIDLQRLDGRVAHRAESRRPRTDRRRGEGIDLKQPGFKEAVDMVQREVRRAIQPLLGQLSWEALPHIDALTREDPASLERDFGTLTNAWDLLCLIKYELSRPDDRARAIAAWLARTVSGGQCFLRDIVKLTLTEVPATLLRDLSATCDADPPPGLDLSRATAPEQILVLLRDHVDRGPSETMEVARRIADSLGFDLYPEHGGFEPGFVTVLNWIGSSSEEIWLALVAAAAAAICTTDSDSVPGEAASFPAELGTHGAPDCGLVADFAGALCLRFGFQLLRTSLERMTDEAGERKSFYMRGVAWRMPGEVRPLLLAALDNGRWPFAWALADMAVGVEPPDEPSRMLHLNALFAAQQMQEAFGFEEEFVERRTIEQYDVSGGDPRHRLIWRSIVGDFEEIEPLLAEAYDTDMTLYEIESWPALRALRRSAEYRRWRATVRTE